jgi:hypothetical protein
MTKRLNPGQKTLGEGAAVAFVEQHVTPGDVVHDLLVESLARSHHQASSAARVSPLETSAPGRARCDGVVNPFLTGARARVRRRGARHRSGRASVATQLRRGAPPDQGGSGG